MSFLGLELSLIFAVMLMSIGLFFIITAVIGLIRFPTFLTKIHAVSVSDSFGVQLFLLGTIIYNGASLDSIKIGLVIIVIYLANPMITMELGNFYINKKDEDD